ncbi:hypothetical protein CK203_051032 [Vitis vinifera]|uniref:DUF4283 domain-containing protein n=1 Tax=Vitis vinifera TaxID=29760 RepID=A0A438GPW2_VITVI|nr:hypothetical protein CK203_051032 [Vitis vinifera]
MRESERERVYAAASSLVRKEKGVITPAREMKIRRGLEGGEEGAVSQLNPRSGVEEDLEKLGRFLASSWGLKGSLGLEKLERSRFLLEFEYLEEAQRISLSGEKMMGEIRLRFEKWNPWSGCREEKEESNEIWVRVFGLPVLLWNPTVLRRVGDECDGFIDIDSKMKKLEELQWARILVRADGGDKPSTLEIGIEEEVFTLALWWELKPSVKKLRVDSRRWGEVKDDSISRSGSCVEVESAIEKTEAQLSSEEGTGRQKRDMGWAGLEAGPSKSWAFEGEGCLMKGASSIQLTGHCERPEVVINSVKRLGWQECNLGWKEKIDQAQESMIRGVEKRSCGLSAVRGQLLKERMTTPDGPETSQSKRWAHVGRGPVAELEEARSSQSMAQNKGKRPLEKSSLLDCRIASNGSSLEGEHLVIWESEEARKTREKVIPSATDKALAEEAMRYDSGLRIERERVMGLLISSCILLIGLRWGSLSIILGC